MKKLLFFLTLLFVAMTTNAQSILKGDMNDDGQLTITDVVLLVNKIIGSSSQPAYTSCPDNNHPHKIDLGLPSGTKWACCNIGATTPKDYGNSYAWGETKEKSIYFWSTYQYSDSYANCQDIGSDIAGTKYDVAHVKWGGSWVMPSIDQIDELLNYCSSTWTNVNGNNGQMFTGPSGGSIFLPAAGFRMDDQLFYDRNLGLYWASTQYPEDLRAAYNLSFAYGEGFETGVFSDYGSRCQGLNVRPISR